MLKNFHRIRIFSVDILLFITAATLLMVGLKTNNLTQPWVYNKDTVLGGPFESSNTNSRFSLVESIVEQKSFFFNIKQAQFSVPDVVQVNDRFFSSFTPGVSFLVTPFYLVGKLFGVAPLASFIANIILACLNGFLIYTLARKLGANKSSSVLGAFTFLFASNALVYASTLSQHHGSTAVILLSLLNATYKRNLANNLWFGLLCGIGFLFDIPNLFMLFPIGIYILYKHFHVDLNKEKIKASINLLFLVILISFLPLAGIFGWYNYKLSGFPLGFAQFLPRTDYFDSAEKKLANLESARHKDPYQPTLPFSNRAQLEGIYVLLFSNERSWLYYSPVLLLGFIGLWKIYQKNKSLSVLIISVISVNITIYSMFGDPWGGWAFGPRYLIPSAALMSVAVAYLISSFRKKVIFWIFYIPLVTYSVIISAAGVLTTANIPPKQESVTLINYVPYTYKYNFMLLNQNQTNGLIYQSLFKNYITAITFYYGYTFIIIALIYLISVTNILIEDKS